MHVLVSGGTGFIGKHLIAFLLAEGWRITVITRSPEKAAQILPGEVRCFSWQELDTPPAPDVFQGIDGVVNLAGTSIGNRRWTQQVKQEILSSRISTTRAVVSAVRRGVLRPQVLVNASAVGYYGPRGPEKITEEEVPGHDFLAGVCQAWEKEAYQLQDPAVRVVTLRTGLVLGQEGALPRMVLPYRFYLGGPLGRGNQWVSWIHVQDLIRMIQFILTRENIRGPVNGTAPNPVTMREFAHQLGQVLHRPAWFPVPEPLLKLALGQMAEMLLHGQRVIPAKMLAAGFPFAYPDLKPALADLLERRKT
ncbi:MAG TPA: TIGR01777 family protein [Clostridia bacterium]|nr:TIGR01777 family protein [Clostridia bacterium]